MSKPIVRWRGERITLVDFGHDCIAYGPFILTSDGSVRADCQCWKTGRFIWAEGCDGHPFDL